MRPLFLLAKTWDLGRLLTISRQTGDHVLVSFIYKVHHSMQHELLLRPMSTFKALAQGLPSDSSSDEEEESIDLRCTRCEKRIRTVSPTLSSSACWA